MPEPKEELSSIGRDEAWFANVKRTYDEYQQESLESIKRNRSYVDKVLADAQTHSVNVNNVALQALQNAVETANLVGKQAHRHSDIAIDRTWNIDEVAQLVANASVFKDAIAAAVAAGVAQSLKK